MDEAFPVVIIESDGKDMFVIVDGVKIAKRGHPGTPQAKAWVSLEPGWTVRDARGGEDIEIQYNGVTIH
jgi:hypothetical protein